MFTRAPGLVKRSAHYLEILNASCRTKGLAFSLHGGVLQGIDPILLLCPWKWRKMSKVTKGTKFRLVSSSHPVWQGLGLPGRSSHVPSTYLNSLSLSLILSPLENAGPTSMALNPTLLLRVPRHGISSRTFSLVFPVKFISSFSIILHWTLVTFVLYYGYFFHVKWSQPSFWRERLRFQWMILDISNSLSLRIFTGKIGVSTACWSMLLKTMSEPQPGDCVSRLSWTVLVYC